MMPVFLEFATYLVVRPGHPLVKTPLVVAAYAILKGCGVGVYVDEV